MNEQVNRLHDNAEAQIRQFGASTESFADGMRSVFEETANYSQRSMKNTAEFIQKIFGERSLENAIRLQSDYVRTQFDDFISQMGKISSIYQGLGHDAVKPIESAVEKNKDATRQ